MSKMDEYIGKYLSNLRFEKELRQRKTKKKIKNYYIKM